MGLIDRLTTLIRRTPSGPSATTAREVPTPPLPSTALTAFQVERDRVSIITLVRRMLDEDPRAEEILATMARDVTRGGFSVKVKRGSGSGAANKAAADLIERLGLIELVTDWVKLTARDGDSFLEITVDSAGDIVKVTRKPTLQLHRNCDDRDDFPDPTRAYWWADELWNGMGAPRDATWFADWQILHARWNHDTGNAYGRPLFASARVPWKRLTEGETDMAVRRKTRAGLKFHHKFPEGTDAPTIEAYKAQNKDSLANPTAAIADYFGTTEIRAIEGDGKLGEMSDIEHHIRTWWLASPVPMALLGYGQDLNRDVLKEQQEQYDRALDALCAWLDKEILQPLIELQWLLKGIWPGALTYQIVRPTRHPITPEMVKTASEAIAAIQKTGLLTEALQMQMLAQFLPGLDPEEALALLKAERAAAAPPPPPTPDPAANPAPDPAPAGGTANG